MVSHKSRKSHGGDPASLLMQTAPRIFAVSLFSLLIAGSWMGVTEASATKEVSNLPERAEVTDKYGEFQLPLFVEEREAAEMEAMVEEAQESVYTVITPEEQGSGFLYNEDGIVITSAHVVPEGVGLITVMPEEGEFYEAALVASSKYMDVALLHVPELEGQEPFSIEKNERLVPGDHVAALGSPEGVEDTVTYGEIEDDNKHLVISDYHYESIYQISAEVEEGNSGGPLLSKDEESFVAINAATDLENPSIGYSVPLNDIKDLIYDLLDGY
ncbi:S1C family serine protease [Salipaludibacillus sp. CUR1]|uniref:S1C family serine protease n=1 Tax=Salipaludibacillus sp. CUR1 TaxID=2820003 RepID=UPI001E64F14C|nr:trypsin-like peptidase domain-containing protein [Salipaludibacillus sp. CUR1]MCE7791711.1 S1C family serine protease [Salipaludibacillus sp. CUR1]